MARARNLKPGFFLNDELAELPPLHRILFAGLWCVGDREGRLEDKPKKLKAEILPYDECDVESMLNDLHGHGFILRYQARGIRCILVLNFKKHQNPHIKEAPSVLPAPEEAPEEHGTSTVLEPDIPERAGRTPAPDSGLQLPHPDQEDDEDPVRTRTKKIVDTLNGYALLLGGQQIRDLVEELDRPPPLLADKPDDWCDWICLAIKESAARNGRNLAYVLKVIQGARERQAPPGSAPPPKPQGGRDARPDQRRGAPADDSDAPGHLTAKLRSRDSGLRPLRQGDQGPAPPNAG